MVENDAESSVMEMMEQDRSPVASSNFTTAASPRNGSFFASVMQRKEKNVLVTRYTQTQLEGAFVNK